MSMASNKLHIAFDGFVEGMLKKIFRGQSPLHPIYVERAVENAIIANTLVFKKGLLPPSNVEILMNEEDYQDFMKIKFIYKNHIEETAKSFIESEFKGKTIGTANLFIVFKEDQSISKGYVEVRAYHCEEAYEEVK